MSLVHRARTIPYDALLAGLHEAKAKKFVSERRSGPFSLWCYTPQCVYAREWNEITVLARGLILDVERKTVVATPFEKFFNVGERGEPIPDLPFEVFEKLDGSLIILWHDGDRWRCSTKGSFDSDQALAAQAWLDKRDACSWLFYGSTYLCEYVAPSNRIVVPYEQEEMVLLAAYMRDGKEFPRSIIEMQARDMGWRVAAGHAFTSVADLIAHTETLPSSIEGFVMRFRNGLRLKAKGAEYRRIHALISCCTPLAMWEAMLADDDLDELRKLLPEEFWADHDAIRAALQARLDAITGAVADYAATIADWPDKRLGLHLAKLGEPLRSFLFPYRKFGDLLASNSRQFVFLRVCPTGNRLEGYTPSYAINRVMEEASG